MKLREIYGLASSRKTPFSVIPAKAGIQSFHSVLDSRLRGSEDRDGLSRTQQVSFSIKLAASAASGYSVYCLLPSSFAAYSLPLTAYLISALDFGSALDIALFFRPLDSRHGSGRWPSLGIGS
jgi:hypothetical protein